MIPLADARARLGVALVCPSCRGELADGAGTIACRDCLAVYPQTAPWLDLLPRPPLWNATDEGWRRRQDDMEGSYRDLVADPDHTRLAYHYDFGPHAPLLADLAGRVLDVGGGNGLVRHFLPASCEYVSVDPGTDWLASPWQDMAGAFPCLGEPLIFVRGVGEYLPFADASIDGVLSFWSLNHCADPARVMAEIARVLRPGGRVLLSVDDMEPSWRDLWRDDYRDGRFSSRWTLVWQKLRARVVGWPLQPDHLRIDERDLGCWAGTRLVPTRRCWIGSYLTLEFQRPPSTR